MVVQYESHSLKQYTRGSETEIIRRGWCGDKGGQCAVQSGVEEWTEGNQTK